MRFHLAQFSRSAEMIQRSLVVTLVVAPFTRFKYCHWIVDFHPFHFVAFDLRLRFWLRLTTEGTCPLSEIVLHLMFDTGIIAANADHRGAARLHHGLVCIQRQW